MSDITRNRFINEALEKLNNEGFKKHRRNFELFSGSLIVINLIGANFLSSKPLGVDLLNSDRPWFIYIIMSITGLYLMYRYIVALQVYLRPHIKEYLENKNQVYFKKKYIPRLPVPKNNPDNCKWLEVQSSLSKKAYGQFELKQNNGVQGHGKAIDHYTVSKWRRIIPNLKHRALMHFQDAALGWDLWMPYYLFIAAIGALIYNYYY